MSSLDKPETNFTSERSLSGMQIVVISLVILALYSGYQVYDGWFLVLDQTGFYWSKVESQKDILSLQKIGLPNDADLPSEISLKDPIIRTLGINAEIEK